MSKCPDAPVLPPVLPLPALFFFIVLALAWAAWAAGLSAVTGRLPLPLPPPPLLLLLFSAEEASEFAGWRKFSANTCHLEVEENETPSRCA
jgi:hypothetical protein